MVQKMTRLDRTEHNSITNSLGPLVLHVWPVRMYTHNIDFRGGWHQMIPQELSITYILCHGVEGEHFKILCQTLHSSLSSHWTNLWEHPHETMGFTLLFSIMSECWKKKSKILRSLSWVVFPSINILFHRLSIDHSYTNHTLTIYKPWIIHL